MLFDDLCHAEQTGRKFVALEPLRIHLDSDDQTKEELSNLKSVRSVCHFRKRGQDLGASLGHRQQRPYGLVAVLRRIYGSDWCDAGRQGEDDRNLLFKLFADFCELTLRRSGSSLARRSLSLALSW